MYPGYPFDVESSVQYLVSVFGQALFITALIMNMLTQKEHCTVLEPKHVP